MPFKDRREAGRRLVPLVERYRGPDTLVLGLARGGLPVAYEVASALGAPLDVMVARKLGAPENPEYGVGALAPGGVHVLDDAAIEALGVTPTELDAIVAEETRELERRLMVYRGTTSMPDVAGKTVILVDDGVATGGTARASLRSIRQAGAARVILAVPVGPPESIASLSQDADAVCCIETPRDFGAVSRWYAKFGQTSDDEVLAILTRARPPTVARPVRIPAGDVTLDADLTVPAEALGLVVFVHGSGSSRKSPRNTMVARRLNSAGLATLLLDLLTAEEGRLDARTAELRFDIPLLARRAEAAIAWTRTDPQLRDLGVGTFGSSTGGAAALIAAADMPGQVRAVVSRGGRPDLAATRLKDVRAPTLLIVGGEDGVVLGINEDAQEHLECEKRLHVVPDATHLFEEPGALEEVATVAAQWFRDHLVIPRTGHEARAGTW